MLHKFSPPWYCLNLGKVLLSTLRMNEEEVTIDGSILEGGGQILRMAVSLSALQTKPISVNNIRAGRSSGPGLRAQHLKGLEVARDVCGAKLWGCQMGSTEIRMKPGKLVGGHFTADTQTAGSVCLLLQVILPCAVFAPSPVQLTLRGGTNAEMAPQIDYTVTVFKNILEKFGATFEGNIEKRGYFPRGGGIVHVRIQPVHKLNPVTMLEIGHVTRVWGRAFVAGNINIQEAKKMAELAQAELQSKFNVPVEVMGYKENPQQAVGNGSGINLFVETSTGCMFGGSALGKRQINVPEIVASATKELILAVQSGGCVDTHIQDQMIILMALADGKSQIRSGPVTLHTKTAIYIAERLSKARFSVEEEPNGTNVISCEGIGLRQHTELPMDT